jgi:hypothetical protein
MHKQHNLRDSVMGIRMAQGQVSLFSLLLSEGDDKQPMVVVFLYHQHLTNELVPGSKWEAWCLPKPVAAAATPLPPHSSALKVFVWQAGSVKLVTLSGAQAIRAARGPALTSEEQASYQALAKPLCDARLLKKRDALHTICALQEKNLSKVPARVSTHTPHDPRPCAAP